MENATKALLIAGSVLVVIILIAIGLKIVNSTKGTVESSQTAMNATEVATYNNKFIQYMGVNKSKNQAIAFMNTVIANNTTSKRRLYVFYNGTGTSVYSTADLSSVITQITNNDDSKKYEIKIAASSGGSGTANGYYISDGAIACMSVNIIN